MSTPATGTDTAAPAVQGAGADLLHQADVLDIVRTAYGAIESPAGAGACLYDDGQLVGLPSGAEEWSLGVGNPVKFAALQPGEDVVDIGSGGGIDTLLAARAVAPGGTATGVDLLPEMVQRARRNASEAGVDNVQFVQGAMEALPLDDASADVVVSNGVVNLSPRKTRTLFEIRRILRRGGRVSLTDIIVDEDLPTEVMTHPSAWAG